MKSVYLILFCFFLAACEKNEIYSGCDTVLENAEGLRIVKKEIEEYSCVTNIYSGELEGKPVYVTSVVDPLCHTNGTVGVYNCSGDFIENIKPGNKLVIGDLLVDNRQ